MSGLNWDFWLLVFSLEDDCVLVMDVELGESPVGLPNLRPLLVLLEELDLNVLWKGKERFVSESSPFHSMCHVHI
jgi:hypothetical protein